MATHSPRFNTKPSTTTATILIALAMVTFPVAQAVGIAVLDPIGVTWEQTDKITPDDADEPGWNGFPSHSAVRFGASIAVDGDTLAVSSSPYHVSQGSQEGCHCTDWVYVFERGPAGEWVQKAKFDNEKDSGLGFSLDLDEESGVIVAGDPGYPRDNDERTGNAFIYERTQEGDWVLAKDVLHDRDPDVDYGRTLGNSVTVDGETVVVSATGETVQGKEIAGAVYVFERGSDGEWEKTDRILPDDPVERMAFGSINQGLALEDGTLAVAAWTEFRGSIDLIEIGDVEGPGAVYIFEQKEHGWTQVERLTAPEGEQSGCFGWHIEMSGERVLVGDVCRGSDVDQAAPWGPPLVARDGQAYIFEKDDQGWGLAATLTPPTRGVFELFAHAGDIEGDRVVIGAPYHPNMAMVTGTAYVYDRIGEDWMMTAMLSTNETLPGDQFGWSVAMTGDESSVYVGAIWDSNRGDDWPYPFDNTNMFVVQETDGWQAGSTYEFRLDPVKLHLEASM